LGSAKSLYGEPWSDREFVIVLHYYFLNQSLPCHKDSEFVREVARLLGRTPASIAMRMENFANLDSDTNRSHKGLSNGGPRCREVFLKWKNRPEHLRSTVEFLLDEHQEAQPDLFTPERVLLPKAFQKYELLDHIGDGGFGSVLSCVDVHSGKSYALKILRTENRFDRQLLHRFFREIRILRSFRHAHVIRLHEDNLETEQSFPAFVMDLAECSLTQYLGDLKEQHGRQRPYLETHESTVVFRSICAAVQALHNHTPRIVHRDINPNNILLLPEGSWVLADFGLAKFVRTAALASSFVTNTRRVGGTTFYAAPEQHEDFTKTDERTDIFALGMLLWELFTRASGSAWPQMAQPELPSGLDAVFGKAVQREQAARYQTVREMAADFEIALKSALPGSEGKARVGR
jgi:tRNA A-37 threonylcarbamoyl transferase component Bud32